MKTIEDGVIEVKTIQSIHGVWRSVAASAILIVGVSGIASADNTTTVAPSDNQAGQQQAGTTTAQPTVAPTTQPTTKKKHERVRRAERGTKNKK